MIRCVTVGVLGLFLLTPSWASGPEEGFPEAWARFEREHLASAERSGMVGSAALFMHGGKTLGVSGQGYSDLASMTPVTRDTIFHWASCTKMFTGIAIMQLRDRGALSLDDPIVKYLPELRQVHNPFGSMDAITLDHLLTHSAGFRAGTWPWMDKEWQDQPRHWSQIVAMLPYTEVLFEPGSQYGYSNPGVIFLGRVIEILSGDDYEVYVDKNILKPLGMHDAFFDNTPYYLEGRRSRVYFSKNGESTDGGSDFDAGITVSNGGLNASLRDMARFAAFLAGGPGAGDPERHRLVLERSSLEAMWERRFFSRETEGAKEFGGSLFHGLDHFDASYVGHTGSQFGYTSFVYVDPAAGTAGVAAFNTFSYLLDGEEYSPHPEKTFYKLRDLMMEKIFPLFRQAPDARDDGVAAEPGSG